MPVDRHRRSLLAAAGMLLLPGCASRAGDVTTAAARSSLAALERRESGRLGVAILDTASGRRVSHRGGERFAMCSTFKVLASAAILARVDTGRERLDRRVVVARDALVPWSPVTEHRVGPPGMTLAELCHASVTVSDNTAANLQLEAIGGPAGLTAWLRDIGDSVTRLDRNEPALNEARPGDPRDTTTPDAMLDTLRALLVGQVLAPVSRGQLADWMVATTTGDRRLRAGLPPGWRVGDKTGTGTSANPVTADVAVAWPAPAVPPLLVVAYLDGYADPATGRDAAMAAVGRIAATLAVSG